MELYLNEDEALNELKILTNSIVSDNEIYVRGREFNCDIKKKVEFIIVVLPHFGEQLSNSLVKTAINGGKKLRPTKSEIFLDNAKRKEAFYVECYVVNIR